MPTFDAFPGGGDRFGPLIKKYENSEGGGFIKGGGGGVFFFLIRGRDYLRPSRMNFSLPHPFVPLLL